MNLQSIDLVAAGTAIIQVFVIAVLVESIALVAKLVMPKRWRTASDEYIPVATIVVGVLICVAYDADLPAALGLPHVPYVGSVITGVLCGRGSNFVHDVIERVRTIQLPAATASAVTDAVALAPLVESAPQRWRVGPWVAERIDPPTNTTGEAP